MNRTYSTRKVHASSQLMSNSKSGTSSLSVEVGAEALLSLSSQDSMIGDCICRRQCCVRIVCEKVGGCFSELGEIREVPAD